MVIVPLEGRLRKLMLFRVVMITTLLLIAVSVEAVSETLEPANPLYLVVAATYLLTLAYIVAVRLGGRPELHVFVQLVVDLFLVTALLYVERGSTTRSGFLLLYPISVLAGSVLLLSRTKGLVLAACATLCYGLLLASIRYGLIPPQGLNEASWLPATQLLGSVFVTGVACVTVALIGSYFALGLQHAGARLVEAAGEVADLRELNKTIVESMQSGLLTADAEGRILYMNSFGEAMFGRGQALRGQTLNEVFRTWLLDSGTLAARAARRELSRLDVSYVHPDGRTLDVGVSVSPLATAEPARGGYLLVFQDLTEIKRLEREVRLKEKLAAVGEMAAALAHEIRNPLGSISGSAQVLMAESNISAEQEKLLEIIRRESKRLSDALNQFLFQVRPSGRPRTLVDVGPVVAERVELLRNAPEVSAGRRIELRIEEGAHFCFADRDQLAQVFWNLSRNGLEAMPEGGVLTVELFRRGNDIVLAVRDQGRGIRAEDQRRVLEPFESGRPLGTGLGLAIVYRIVQDHGGDVAFRSTPESGTSVEVRLPVAPAKAAS